MLPSGLIFTMAGLTQLHIRRQGNTGAYDAAGAFHAGSRNTFTNTDGSGFYVGKTNSSVSQIFKDSVQQASLSVAGTLALTPSSLYIGAYNNSENNNEAQDFGNKECAFASIGNGLTDAKVAQLSSIVQTFETTLGRQVN